MQTQIPSTCVVPVNTAEQLLSELDKYLHNGFGDLDSVIFRGVPDSTFELIPTALRSDAASLRRFQDFNQYSSADARIFFQKLVEWDILQEFYFFANRHGSSLPAVQEKWHSALISTSILAKTVKEKPNLWQWPHIDLQRSLALAQHHGLPTRLLDWTFDRTAAAYFASRNACQEAAASNATHIAVWCTTVEKLELVQILTAGDNGPFVIHPPRHENKNLNAQKGVFTLCRQDTSPQTTQQETDRRPLNVFIADNLAKISPDGLSDRAMRLSGRSFDRDEPLFVKFTLPIKHSPDLMEYLMLRGCDAAQLFPGHEGAAKSVEDRMIMRRARRFWERSMTIPL